MTKFTNKWNIHEYKSLKDKLGRVIKSEKPLKPIIEHAIKEIRVQIAKLDLVYAKIRERALKIFNSIVIFIERRDMQHASMLANELSEVKRIIKLITQSKLALEQIVLRLETVKDLGEITSSIGPTIPVIKSIKTGLVGVIPEAENKMIEISDLLNEVVVNASQIGEGQISFKILNEDAERILAEASAIAEDRIKDNLPEIPHSLSRKIQEVMPETT